MEAIICTMCGPAKFKLGKRYLLVDPSTTKKPKNIDVCPEHDRTLQRFNGALKPSDNYKCSCKRTFGSRRGLGRHASYEGHKLPVVEA